MMNAFFIEQATQLHLRLAVQDRFLLSVVKSETKYSSGHKVDQD